jgi:hypothetical protein
MVTGDYEKLSVIASGKASPREVEAEKKVLRSWKDANAVALLTMRKKLRR